MATHENGAVPILVLLVALIVAIFGGYYVLSKGMIPGAPAVPAIPGLALAPPRATEKDFAFIEDPLIRKHFVAMANVNAFRTTMELTGKGGQNVSDVEMSGDNVKFYTSEVQNGKPSGEMISIGDTTYLKDYKDNAWWKQVSKPDVTPTPGETPAAKPEDFKTVYEDNRTMTYEKQGEESCMPAGRPAADLICYKYKEIDPKSPDTSRVFWFDKNKLLLRREETGFGEFKGMTSYEYDNIHVSAPTPTKNVPEGKSIYDYMTFGNPDYIPAALPQTQTAPVFTPPTDTSAVDQAPADPGTGDASQ